MRHGWVVDCERSVFFLRWRVRLDGWVAVSEKCANCLSLLLRPRYLSNGDCGWIHSLPEVSQNVPECPRFQKIVICWARSRSARRTYMVHGTVGPPSRGGPAGRCGKLACFPESPPGKYPLGPARLAGPTHAKYRLCGQIVPAEGLAMFVRHNATECNTQKRCLRLPAVFGTRVRRCACRIVVAAEQSAENRLKRDPCPLRLSFTHPTRLCDLLSRGLFHVRSSFVYFTLRCHRGGHGGTAGQSASG